MKVITPEISWHERDPIYSVDFQPGKWPIQRLASGGVDKIVRIWQMTTDAEGKGDFEFLSNLRRHTATVNIVRFSKDGNLLATAGDDTAIILWKLSDVPTPANNIFADDDVEEDKETWVCHKSLRGHLGDVADLSWSKDNRYLVSGSVDNSAIVWDVVKGTKLNMFTEHKSYVQGVAFDPLGTFVATLSADRSMRIYSMSSKSCVHNVSKLSLPAPPVPTAQTASENGEANNTQPEVKPKAFRIFHDDSLRSFFRRLEFSPDGQLLVTPAGCMEANDKPISASFIFTRNAFAKPSVYLPSGEKSSTVVRINPQLFQLRSLQNDDSQKADLPEWEKKKSLFCLPYRMVYAVATEDCVLIYDTQQTMPVGLLKNIHYHQLSDLSWSNDGRALIVSSTDGFCTVATFEEDELGLPYRSEAGVAVETVREPVAQVNQPSRSLRQAGEIELTQTPDKLTSTSADNKVTEKGDVSKESPKASMEFSETEATKTPQPPSSESEITHPKTPEKSDEKPSKDSSDVACGTEVKGLPLEGTSHTSDPTSSEQTSVTDQVETLNLQESISPSPETEETQSPKTESPSSSSNKQEPVAKGEPKKKRIQFTTLSLLK